MRTTRPARSSSSAASTGTLLNLSLLNLSCDRTSLSCQTMDVAGVVEPAYGGEMVVPLYFVQAGWSEVHPVKGDERDVERFSRSIAEALRSEVGAEADKR